MAAVNEAIRAAEDMVASEMGKITGKVNILTFKQRMKHCLLETNLLKSIKNLCF